MDILPEVATVMAATNLRLILALSLMTLMPNDTTTNP